MDNMNTMDFNQKIDVSLRASLEATPVERNASDDLSTGSSSDGFWNLIVLYTGSPQTLQNEFPSSRWGLCRIWKPAGSDAVYAQCTDGGKEGILHCKDIKRGKGNNCKKL